MTIGKDIPYRVRWSEPIGFRLRRNARDFKHVTKPGALIRLTLIAIILTGMLLAILMWRSGIPPTSLHVSWLRISLVAVLGAPMILIVALLPMSWQVVEIRQSEIRWSAGQHSRRVQAGDIEHVRFRDSPSGLGMLKVRYQTTRGCRHQSLCVPRRVDRPELGAVIASLNEEAGRHA